MALIDTLEHRFGRFAIPGITRILAGFQVLVFLLILIGQNDEFYNLLILDRGAILQGQIWRLFSYMFLPVSSSALFVFFQAWILWFIGDAIEQAWGAFRLNLFIFTGMAALTIAAFTVGQSQTNIVLISTLFLAFATLFPNVEFLLFFILPVKVKWLALITAGLLAFQFLGGSLVTRISILAGVVNYLIFFGPATIRAAIFQGQVAERRRRFEAASRELEAEPLHRCITCRRTDETNPDLDFRIAADGEEYCVDHLPKR